MKDPAMNDLETFKASVDRDAPPTGLGGALEALWYAAKGDWKRAHRLAQAQRDGDGAWVHAHLHRIEGDQANAGHWYRRAGKRYTSAPLKEEWDRIVAALLER